MSPFVLGLVVITSLSLIQAAPAMSASCADPGMSETISHIKNDTESLRTRETAYVLMNPDLEERIYAQKDGDQNTIKGTQLRDTLLQEVESELSKVESPAAAFNAQRSEALRLVESGASNQGFRILSAVLAGEFQERTKILTQLQLVRVTAKKERLDVATFGYFLAQLKLVRSAASAKGDLYSLAVQACEEIQK